MYSCPDDININLFVFEISKCNSNNRSTRNLSDAGTRNRCTAVMFGVLGEITTIINYT